ncbi:phosphatidylinositol glycan class W [Klebsormidium nitens]|uniref:Phosphatidylinositol glycan class W n=1 Tax=Klebsormidium nitens TaxID=105231 RepID=A0A1Y1I9B8_KLENI|nr:phosphatidylinositol glycan class W [Klebsormidium nitens]|eukprot:GAQ86552.1 phosphatidylinositol glycan class W [Klebsormidium nitens]
MDATELKRLKEEFVSNLEGTTMLEISSVMGLTPVAVFFRLVLAAFLDQTQGTKRSRTGKHRDSTKAAASSQSTLLDFLVIVMPTLYCMTHPEAVWPSILFFSVASAFLVLIAKRQWASDILCFPCPSRHVLAGIASPKKPFLSKYRASMMLLTVIAILAVDFDIFPRRFGKAETFGTGLMDVGVGSFVVANGVVSREARGVPTPPRGGLRRTSPLLLLGFARLAATKAAGYQEHVGEYGTHWNFFFTLAAVELLTSAAPIGPGRAGLVGAVVLAGYQAVLSKSNLSEVLMSNHRGASLLSQNKEGVASAFGYWALYLLSVQLGRFFATSAAHAAQELAPGKTGESRESDLQAGRHWWRFAGKVWGLQLALWVCTNLADAYIERVSRRSCNLAYVLWMLAFNLQAISMFVTFDLLLPPRSYSLLDAIDYNLLPIFLLGNLLTGLVNMSIDTLHTPRAHAFIILTLYIGVVSWTAWVLHRTRVRLAFW